MQRWGDALQTETCPNQWTSMRGVIRFWYTTALRPYRAADGSMFLIRELLFRAFGQKCAKCGATNQEFQQVSTAPPVVTLQPMWYEREVKKVLTKIFEHIARSMYSWNVGGALAAFCRPRIESQRGAPTAEHKSELCQGCANNTCSLSTNFRHRSRSFRTAAGASSGQISPSNRLEQIRESSRSPKPTGHKRVDPAMAQLATHTAALLTVAE